MPGAEAHDARRMSDFESVMWELERDPRLSSAFANLTTFDRPPDRERLQARMERASRRVPRLRQRVVPAPARLSTPEWREDPHFDLDHHLRWVDLGGDATDRDLLDLVAVISRQPFDRARPLWEFVVIEGLAGNRAAMVQRMHHTITDGEGGIRLSVEFLDLERDPSTDTGGDGADRATAGPDAADAGPAATPVGDTATDPAGCGEGSLLGRTAGAVGHGVREGLGQVVRGAAAVGGLAAHPTEIPRRGADVAALARSTVRQARLDGRRSPLWVERSLDRWFATAELDLEEVRRAAKALGVSINDLFVTGATEAAARAHERAGTPVEELRVSIPVSTRHDRRAGGNAFAPSQTLVPAGPMDPLDRLAAVHERLQRVKEERALGSLDGLASVMNRLPAGALVRAGQWMAGSVDFVCSNVRAAPFDLYIAGAFVEGNYPIGPLAGTAFNLTTMSYRGRLFMGLMTDPAAVHDGAALLTDLRESYAELLAAGGVSSPDTA